MFSIKQDNSGWDPVDKGRSKLLIMYTPATHTTRVIAQCETDRKWVLNVFATPSVSVTYLTELFVDWQDPKNHYGLGFDDKELAAKFVTTIEAQIQLATQNAAALAAAAATAAPQPALPQPSGGPPTMGGGSMIQRPSSGGAPVDLPARTSSNATLSVRSSSTAALSLELPRSTPAISTPVIPAVAASDPGLLSGRSRSRTMNPGVKPPTVVEDMDLGAARGSMEIPRESSSSSLRPAGGGQRSVSQSLAAELGVDGGTLRRCVAKSGWLLRPQAELTARENLIRELYTSEISYVNSLNDLVHKCYEPMTDLIKKKKDFLPEDQVLLFSNVQSIKVTHEAYLTELESILIDYAPEKDLLLAQLLNRTMRAMTMYPKYCSNFNAAIKFYEKLLKEGKKSQKEYLASVESSTGMALNFLLIMPVQRIPRYRMMIQDIVKKTEESAPSRPDFQAALQIVSGVAEGINMNILTTESTQILATLKKTVIGIEAIASKQSRKIIKEGPLRVQAMDRSFVSLILFNDLVAFCSPVPKEKKKTTIDEQLPLQHCWIDGLQDDHFKLRFPEVEFEVFASSSEEASHWLDVFRRAISAVCQKLGLFKEGASDEIVRVFSYTYADGHKYDGEWISAVPEGRGTSSYRYGSTYVGEFAGGRFSGKGVLTYANGDTYDGEWRSGWFHGVGKVTSAVFTFEGEVKRSMFHGPGKITYSNGSSYEGMFDKNQRCGQGKFVNLGVLEYEGEWTDDLMNGSGVLTYALGKYSGSFSMGRFSGKGSLTYTCGDTYNGEFLDGLYHGTGEFCRSDKQLQFSGEWRRGQYHGKGKLTQPHLVYEGEFADGWRCGQGRLLMEDVGEYVGEFQGDRFHGKGRLTYSNGSSYDGNWQDGRRFGNGVFIDADATRYDGRWANDLRDGRGGVQTYPDGSRYSGAWVQGMRHGEGVYTGPGETFRYSGEWENDMRCGSGVLSDDVGVYDGSFRNNMRCGRGLQKFQKIAGMEYSGNWQADKPNEAGILSFVRDGEAHQIDLQFVNGSFTEFSKIPEVYSFLTCTSMPFL